MHLRQNLAASVATLLFGAGMIIYAGLAGRLFHQKNVYGTVSKNTALSFSEDSTALGLSFRAKTRAGIPGSLAVGDFDNDGYPDLFVSSSDPLLPSRLFHNVRGEKFEEQLFDLGLHDLKKAPVSGAAWIDFDNDGFLDLLVTRYGCPQLYKNQGPKGRFKLIPFEGAFGPDACASAHAIAIADIDGDGFLDIAIGVFADSDNQDTLYQKFVPAYNDKIHGGKSFVLMRNEHPHFNRRYDFPNRPFTQALGLSYIDSGKTPFVFVGNDYSTDALYRMAGDGPIDVTGRYLPFREHSMAGMNSEFADVFNRGKMDLFVSGMYEPPFHGLGNVFWERQGDAFVNKAREYGLSQCGFAWAAKFADFDLDGNLELALVNGLFRGKNVKKSGDGIDEWPFRLLRRASPDFMRVASRRHFDDLDYSGFERRCLFERKNGVWTDVAEAAGFISDDPTRSMALIDFNNDGRADLATLSLAGHLSFYTNTSQPKGSWVGVQFRILDQIVGLRGLFRYADATGKEIAIAREMFPTNGYKGQSDSRWIFGLGDYRGKTSLQLTWADGTQQIVEGLELGKYNLVEKKQNK